MKKLVRNGRVVDPSQGLNGPMDVLIEHGRIVDVAPGIPTSAADVVVDAKGLVVAPGFIDLNVYLREPGNESSETIETGSKAAAAGGFTTIYCMPNTKPPCDSTTGISYVLTRAAAVGVVRIIPVAAVTRRLEGKELADFGKLKEAGAGAFSDDIYPIMNSEIMRRALEYTRILDMPIFDHCEDINLSGTGLVHEGRVGLRLGLKGIPRTSESIMVMRDVALAAMTGGHLHIRHVSTRESVSAIREARRHGVRVTAEVSPQHLTMTEEAILQYNTNAKMKPPLCDEEDRAALVEALNDGTIDCVATTHAPHSAAAKEDVFDSAPYGVIGLESAFPVLYTHFVATGQWSLEFLIDRMTQGPAKVMNKPWGTLRRGAPADLTLLRLDAPYTFSRGNLRSKSGNCPWLGREMKALVAATIVDGKLAFACPDVFPHGHAEHLID